MVDERYVHFVELAGDDARAHLEAQAARWRGAGVRATLLRSDEQDGLWLLVGSAAAAPPTAEVAGARVWRFTRLDESQAEERQADGSQADEARS